MSLVCSRLRGYWKDACRKVVRENTRGGNFKLKIKCDRKFASGIIYLLGRAFLFLLRLLVEISASKRESRYEELLAFRAGCTFQ